MVNAACLSQLSASAVGDAGKAHAGRCRHCGRCPHAARSRAPLFQVSADLRGDGGRSRRADAPRLWTVGVRHRSDTLTRVAHRASASAPRSNVLRLGSNVAHLPPRQIKPRRSIHTAFCGNSVSCRHPIDRQSEPRASPVDDGRYVGPRSLGPRYPELIRYALLAGQRCFELVLRR